MKKAMGSILVTILAICLLVYTASRTFNFISMTLPVDQQILAYFALAALDGGMPAWLLTYLHGARGGMQRAISMGMVVIDFLGIVTMFTADTLLNTGKAGLTTALDENSIHTIILALSIIIALNIGAVVGHHLTDPDTRRAIAEEEAQSKIQDETLKRLDENSGSLAATLAPRIAADWLREIEIRNTSSLKLPKAAKIELPVIPQQLLEDTGTPQALPVKSTGKIKNTGTDVPVPPEDTGTVASIDTVNPTSRRKAQ